MAVIFDAQSSQKVLGTSSNERLDITLQEVATTKPAGSTDQKVVHGVMLERSYPSETQVYSVQVNAANLVGDPSISVISTSGIDNGDGTITLNDAAGWGDAGAGGLVENIANGDINLYASGEGRYPVKRSHTLRSDPDVADPVVVDYETGTLSKHCLDNMRALVSGLTYDKSLQYHWTSANGDVDNPVINFNDSLFVDRHDFSFGLYQDDGRKIEPALVTARHAILARHVTGNTIPGSTRFLFETPSGEFIAAKVLAMTPPDIGDVGHDLMVLYFDTDLSEVGFHKTMPEGWHTRYCPAQSAPIAHWHLPLLLAGVPYLRRAGHTPDGAYGEAFQINFAYGFTDYGIHNGEIYTGRPLGSGLSDWGKTPEPGDSGGPGFFLINGEWVLITTQWTTMGASNIAEFTQRINAIMNEQADAAGDPDAGSYALQHPDLSAFTDFSV